MKNNKTIIKAITPLGTFESDPVTSDQRDNIYRGVKSSGSVVVTLIVGGCQVLIPNDIVKNSIWEFEAGE